MNGAPPEILYLVVGRGGSRGVPGKNLRKIGGLSLVALKTISARRSRYCTRVIASSDSAEIQAEAKAHGAEVLFTRPAHLATHTASSDDVVLHAMDHIEDVEKRRYDAIMLLEPASPFSRPSDYDAAVELYLRHKASLVVGMRETPVNSIFVGPLRRDGRADQIVGKFFNRPDLRRQAFEQEYTMNGALYLIDWTHMRRTGKVYGDPDRTFGYPMDTFHSAEIDSLHDLRLAEFYVQNGDVDIAEWR